MLGNKWRQLLAALLACIAGLAPLAGPAGAQEPAQLLVDEPGYLRFVHASLTGSNLSFLVDGELLVQGLGYGSATDVFISVPPGTHTVVAQPDDGSGTPLAEMSMEIGSGAAYHVAAVGTAGATAIDIYPIEPVEPAEGRALLRLINCAPDVVAASILGLGDPAAIAGIGYQAASGAVEIEAGVYELTLALAGAGQELSLPLGPVPLEAGVSYDMFVIGLVADGSASYLLIAA